MLIHSFLIFGKIVKCKATMHRAGVCLIDPKQKKILVLKRKTVYEKTWRSNPRVFLEQYSLPRGGCKNRKEPPLTCAIREFIEETGFFPKEGYISSESFNLFWYDPENVKWEYSIYFVLADLSNENKIKIDDNSNIFIPLIDESTKICRFSKYEPAVAQVMSLETYICEMNLQLCKYGKTNYKDLLEMIKKFSYCNEINCNLNYFNTII